MTMRKSSWSCWLAIAVVGGRFFRRFTRRKYAGKSSFLAPSPGESHTLGN